MQRRCANVKEILDIRCYVNAFIFLLNDINIHGHLDVGDGSFLRSKYMNFLKEMRNFRDK